MKNFLVPVARVCAEIVEMTSNAAQDAWRGRSENSIAPAEKNTAESRENCVVRRPSILAQRPLSGSHETNSGGEPEIWGTPAFDVASFCSELEAWRVSLISPQMRPIADERQSYVKRDLLVENSRADLGRSPTSLENELTRAVRNVDRSSGFGPVARPPRGI